jgi:shikimate kinase
LPAAGKAVTALMVLIGLPGAGKTSAGRRAARRLQVDFADSDSLIEARAGASVSDIFAGQGETAFRTLEAEVIAEALGRFGGILALGGGAVTTPAVRDALAESDVPVVHLVTSAASALARVGDGSSRPLLRGDPAGRLVVLERERRPLYETVATVAVQAGGRPISRIVDELVELGRATTAARSTSAAPSTGHARRGEKERS